jgi:uncharacterized membrane protein YhaH (DUF805 family)
MDWMFLPLKRYAEFSGRSRRMEYWMFFLFQMLVGIAFWGVLMTIGGAALMAGGNLNSLVATGGALMMVIGLWSIVNLALFIPALAVGVRRLHDTNHSGWWLLAPVAPYLLTFAAAGMAASSSNNAAGAGILALLGGLASLGLLVTVIVFLFMDGTRGDNRFGPDPKGPNHGEVFA